MKAIPPLLALVLLFLCSGCNDRPTDPAGSNPSSTPVDHLNNSVKAEKRAFKTIDLAAVNKAIESFYVQEGRFPKDLTELVDKSYISEIPELPEGATWNYDTNAGIATVQK